MKQKRKLLIAQLGSWHYLEEKDYSTLEKYKDTFEVVVKSGAVTREDVKDAEIIFGQVNKEWLKDGQKLKWLMILSAGLNGYEDKSLYANDNIILSNSSGIYGVPIAEYILGGVLSLYRGFNVAHYNQSKSRWSSKGISLREVSGATVAIIGFGDIGYETGKRFRAMGAKVLAVKKHMISETDGADEVYVYDAIDEVLRRSDIVVLSVPLTKETRHIINRARLEQMKEDAIIVNIGRGELIEQEVLIKALRERKIGGAVLDVTQPEPLPEDSELWRMENVIITPHFSGTSPYTNRRRLELFFRNLDKYIENSPLENIVDFEQGY